MSATDRRPKWTVTNGQGVNGKLGEQGLAGLSVSPDGSTLYGAERYFSVIRKITSA